MDCSSCTECVKTGKIIDESAIVLDPQPIEKKSTLNTTPTDFCESLIVQQALKEEQAKLKSTIDYDVVHVEERCFHLARTAALIGDKRTLKSLASTDSWILNATDVTSGRPLLTYATLADQTGVIKWLIKNGAQVDVKDIIQRTPLHWASHRGHHDIVKILLDNNSDCTLMDAEGVSPLHLAIKQTSTKCLHLMLDQIERKRINPKYLIDNKGRTPVHWAAASGFVDHLQVIVKHKLKFDVNQGDDDGRTPLMWAALNNLDSSLACCKILIDKSPGTVRSQDKCGFSALHYAVSVNNASFIELLLRSKHCNTNVLDNSYRTPLHWACKLNLLDVVHLLLKNGALLQTDGAGATPLHYAAQGDHVKLVEKLLSLSNPKKDLLDSDGKSALMYAASSGASSVIESMMRLVQVEKEQKDYNGSTALHLAAQSGQPVTLQLLIKYNWALEALDNHGLTPLLSAAEAGHAQCVQILLKAGAAIGQKDKNGGTALHWAALGGHAYVCQLLVKQGLNPDFADFGGRSPLHCASFAGHHECISVLLQANADLYAADNEGYVPLHLASEEGHLKCVKMLVEAGSVINTVCTADDKQLTSLDLARNNGHILVVDYLTSCGALSYQNLIHVAAAKIQASFRGYRMRKTFLEMKKMKVVRQKGSPRK